MIAAIERLAAAATPRAKILIDLRIADGLDENSEILLNVLIVIVPVGCVTPPQPQHASPKRQRLLDQKDFSFRSA
jgi:hypothetical protein